MIIQEQLPMVAMPSMNDTHLEEILIINRLDVAARKNKIAEVSEILKELLEHTAMHFFDEEDMMKEADFPAYQTHKNEHDRHIQELKALIEYFDEKKDTKAIYIYIEGSLTPWMIDHVKTMDTVMAVFFKEGLSTESSATKDGTTGNC